MCGDIRLILRLRIEDFSDFRSTLQERMDREEKSQASGASLESTFSHHCSVTLTVTVKLSGR